MIDMIDMIEVVSSIVGNLVLSHPIVRSSVAMTWPHGHPSLKPRQGATGILRKLQTSLVAILHAAWAGSNVSVFGTSRLGAGVDFS